MNPEALFQKAYQQYQQGQFQAASASLKKLLSKKPKFANAWQLAGLIELKLKKPALAATHLQKSCQLQPNNPEAWNNLGYAFKDLRKTDSAIAAFSKTLTLKANPVTQADAFNNIGQLYLEKNETDLAKRAFDKAIAAYPKFAESYNNLGLYYQKQKDYNQAIEQLNKALRLKSNYVTAQFNLGNVYQDDEQYHLAITSYQKTLSLDPNHTAAMTNAMNSLMHNRQYKEAEKLGKILTEKYPNDAQALCNLGNCYFQLTQLDDAFAYYQRAKQANPSLTDANLSQGFIQLLRGNYVEGWAQFEWRRQLPVFTEHQQKRYRGQEWEGEPCQGKRLLVYMEQGYGDFLQFSRFIPQLVSLGCELIVETPHPLLSLVEHNFSQYCTVTSMSAPLPNYDLQIALMSLPHRLNITLENIPTVLPYYRVPANNQSKYQHLAAETKYKVGITWAGNPNQKNDHNRSCPMAELEKIFSLRNISWYSLQKDMKSGDAEICAKHNVNTRCIADANDYADTAAIIEQLDKVISVCTSVCHLSGMMNQKTLALLCFAADWRWLESGETTPWYPNTSLLRQQAPNDWRELMNRLCDMLMQLSSGSR